MVVSWHGCQVDVAKVLRTRGWSNGLDKKYKLFGAFRMAFLLIHKGFASLLPSKNINGWEGILTIEAGFFHVQRGVFVPFIGRVCSLRPTNRRLSLRNTSGKPDHVPLAARAERPTGLRPSPTLFSAGLRCLARAYLYGFCTPEKMFQPFSRLLFSLGFHSKKG